MSAESKGLVSLATLGRWCAFVVLGLFLVHGSTSVCAKTDAAGAGDPSTEPYRFEARSGAMVPAERGTFSVPENRAAGGSRRIALRYVRFPSTSSTPGSPIVYLAGGPGGSGTGAARGSRFPLFQALRAYGDVIAFDQRGTGMSEPDLDCHERYQLPLDKPLNRRAWTRSVNQASRACADRLTAAGIDLRGYNTLESAHDLEDLRRVLGADKLTLWGISYGTHLALATLAAHGERIDRLMLAGVEGPDDSWKLPSDQQALMRQIATVAARDPATRAKVPDLVATVARLLAKLAREPQQVALPEPRTGGRVTVSLGPLDLRVALAGMLRGPASFASMPDLVARLEAGDWVPLALFSMSSRSGSGYSAMSWAMDCASGATSARLDRIAKEARDTLLADAINLPFPDFCDGLPVADLGDGFRRLVRSPVPALLISGTLDGRTPPSNAERALAGLPNGRHLVIEGAGHSDPLFLSSPEILRAMEAFLRGEETIEHIALEPIQFLAPRKVVAIAPTILERYVGSYRVPGGDIRKVLHAGGMLFTQRGTGRPFAIRSSSPTTFFYEDDATHLRFDLDPDGQVTGMTVFPGGAEPGIFAPRIDEPVAGAESGP